MPLLSTPDKTFASTAKKTVFKKTSNNFTKEMIDLMNGTQNDDMKLYNIPDYSNTVDLGGLALNKNFINDYILIDSKKPLNLEFKTTDLVNSPINKNYSNEYQNVNESLNKSLQRYIFKY